VAIGDRLADAELLWTCRHRGGALLSVLVAATALERKEHPALGDGEAFRRFTGRAHTWSIEVEHRANPVSVDQLLWKWLRCELAHAGDLPVDVRFWDFDDNPDDLRIQAGGAPEFCIRISDGWYLWLRRLVEGSVRETVEKTGTVPRGW
jgi:hypothetical protein